MSIIAYYARMDTKTLDKCRNDPDALFQLEDSQLADLDKEWEAVAWLISPAKRLMMRQESSADVRKIVEPDIPMIALQGGTEPCEPTIDFGLGQAFRLDADRVAAIAASLGQITAEDLRNQFQPEAMDNDGVYPQIWCRDGIEALERGLIPSFFRLQQFYADAAKAQQIVLIFFS